jgi:hypothetical protein
MNRPQKFDAPLALVIALLRIRGQVLEVNRSILVVPLSSRSKRDFRVIAPFAQNTQSRVYRYASHPGIEARPTFKISKCEECAKERILHCVFSVLSILRNVEDCSENAPRVEIPKLAERRSASCFCIKHQPLIAS